MVDKDKGGRPTKWTPQVQAAICEAILGKQSRHAAAGLGGITYQTLLNWLERGEKAAPGDEDFARFFDAFKEAEALVEGEITTTLLETETSWQRFAWWLERRFPQVWGKVDRTELTGKDGGPMQHEHGGDAIETLASAIARLAARTAEEAGDGDPDAGAGSEPAA